MSDIIHSDGRIVNPNNSSSSKNIDDAFDDILTGLNSAEAKKEQAIREELKNNYDNWARHIELLKEQFGETWELFGRIEEKVQGWYRGTTSYGQWDFMGASGYGYNFGASIHYTGNNRPTSKLSRNLMHGSKFLKVSFGCSFSDMAGNGVGDERDVGRTSELDDNLVGLENCDGRTLSHKLSGSKYMLEKLNGHGIYFSIHNEKMGRGTNRVNISSLYTGNMKEICQKLFVAINQDEEIYLPKYLPTP